MKESAITHSFIKYVCGAIFVGALTTLAYIQLAGHKGYSIYLVISCCLVSFLALTVSYLNKKFTKSTSLFSVYLLLIIACLFNFVLFGLNTPIPLLFVFAIGVISLFTQPRRLSKLIRYISAAGILLIYLLHNASDNFAPQKWDPLSYSYIEVIIICAILGFTPLSIEWYWEEQKLRLQKISRLEFIELEIKRKGLIHDLSQPITSLGLAIDMLYKENPSSRLAYRNAKNAISSIVSLLHSNEDKGEKKYVNLSTKLEELISRTSSTKRFALDVKSNNNYEIDLRNLERVLQNTLQNAVNYSPIGSTIKVEANESKGKLEIRITNKIRRGYIPGAQGTGTEIINHCCLQLNAAYNIRFTDSLAIASILIPI